MSRVCHGVGVCGREGLKTKAVNRKCFMVDQVFQV